MELTARLRQVRNRLLKRVFLQQFVLSFSAAMLLAGAALLLAAWQGWQLPLLTLLLSALFLALTFSALLTLRTDTSYLRTARLVEANDPGLHARLSTALELTRSGDDQSPLRQLQLKDAARQAANIKASDHISFRLPAHLLTMLLSGLVVLGGGLLLDNPVRQRQLAAAPAAATTADLSEDEQLNLSSSLQQLAEIFAPETDSGSDPYLEAIGRQLQELGTRLETEPLTREQLTSELERLLQHTQTALELREGQETAARQADLTELLEAALRDVRQPDDRAMADLPDPDMTGSPAAADAGLEPTDGEASDMQAAEPPSLEDLLAAENEPESRSAQAQSTGEKAQSRTGSYFDYTLDKRTIAELNARAMEAAMSEAAGEAIGASSQSQEGASSLAGDGTDDLFGSEAASQLNAERIEQLSVSEETDPEGRHVRIEVNPEAEFTEVFATPLGATAWSRSTEAEVMREALMTDQRLVTARYHTPEQAE